MHSPNGARPVALGHLGLPVIRRAQGNNIPFAVFSLAKASRNPLQFEEHTGLEEGKGKFSNST